MRASLPPASVRSTTRWPRTERSFPGLRSWIVQTSRNSSNRRCEEKAADAKLTKLAERGINKQAADASGEDDEEDDEASVVTAGARANGSAR